MSLAADTRQALEEYPFLQTALRADVVNYTAAARFLSVDGDTDAVATALRRYAEELPPYDCESRDVRVRMESGFGRLENGTNGEAFLRAGTAVFGPTGGDLTVIVATGEVDSNALTAVLLRVHSQEVTPVAAGVSEDALIVVVDHLEGATALRAIENALETVVASHH
ncbi:hypothetical protein D8Y22_10955 [Salinadaptatus halalkaliphilus]|uniref:ACT domain-containing protein n=1 Tax=Salinadaptatus halalkaliphilus TaxID=2419781 RepID=A0A4S3TKU5_9EURY|nr:hypothetical protein [Salinadaptatus halalkaliphilus]THE64769.1 hypothetical protein D8Y22_10955 [Salinadaptatus halalkaliphilus]